MNDTNPWQTLSTKIVYENQWIRVREDAVIQPDGNGGIYGVVESKDSVLVVAVNDENKVYMIRSFNYPSSTWSWGLPGGGGDDEEPITAAQRELAEETGISAKKWTHLGTTRVCSGLMTERMTVYLAQDLTFGDCPEADDKELIEQGKFMSLQEIDELIKNNQIDDTQTITGVYLAQRWLSH